MAITVYGIKNCDTVKKARKWLDKNSVDYLFHDFRTDGINRKLIDTWLQQTDWNVLLNTRGTTWRNLPKADREAIDKAKAIKLILAHPTLIKRPVLSVNKQYYVGFTPEKYQSIFPGSSK